MVLSAVAKRKLKLNLDAEIEASGSGSGQSSQHSHSSPPTDIQHSADSHDIAINAFFHDADIQQTQRELELEQENIEQLKHTRNSRKKLKPSSADAAIAAATDTATEKTRKYKRKQKQKAQHYDYNCVSNFATCSATTFFGDRYILVGFDAHATLILAGKFTLQVLKGTLSILGARIGASVQHHRIYAPTCYPLPTLSSGDSSGNGDSPAIDSDSVPPSLAHNQLVVRLSPLDDGLEGLGNALPDFRHAFASPYAGVYDGWRVVEGMYPVRVVLLCLSLTGTKNPAQILESTPNTYAFLTPPSWTSAATQIARNAFHSPQPYIAIVKGGRNTGKSAFSRYLCNALRGEATHANVAYLECDVGQSEFMPSGCVSLHLIDEFLLGPPFTHPRIPSKAHFVGELSPANDPVGYIDAVRDLIEFYQREIAHSHAHHTHNYTPIPLIINTQGWVKGLGAEMLQGICDAAGIFELIEMSQSVSAAEEGVEDDTYADNHADIPANEDISTPARNVNHMIIDAIATADNPMLSRYHSADYRNLSMTTYFHANIPEKAENVPNNSPTQISDVRWDFSKPLTHFTPLTVDYANDLAYVCILHGEDVIYEHTLMAMNASVVALMEGHVEGVCEGGIEADERLTRRDNLLTHKDSRVLGYGLIRAVDSSVNQLQLLTPLTPKTCRRVHVLAKGKVDLPIYASLDWTKEVMDYGSIPYITNEATVGEGAQKRKVRRDIQRKPGSSGNNT
ncbi:hypothetical protein E3P98_03414 [Wallemia ichthyophaga]|nr:hypothetical protein E3P98_03414 [Wallemia ichthyophaga]